MNTSGADDRAMLAVAVVVHGDRAGADVAARPDVGIAQIGQMVGLGAAPHARGLELDEVADMRARRPRPSPAGYGRTGR